MELEEFGLLMLAFGHVHRNELELDLLLNEAR